MDSIDVHDLPASTARAIAEMVDAIRVQVQGQQATDKLPNQPIRLPVWPGKVKGSLRRAEIYDGTA